MRSHRIPGLQGAQIAESLETSVPGNCSKGRAHVFSVPFTEEPGLATAALMPGFVEGVTRIARSSAETGLIFSFFPYLHLH